MTDLTASQIAAEFSEITGCSVRVKEILCTTTSTAFAKAPVRRFELCSSAFDGGMVILSMDEIVAIIADSNA